MLGVFRAPTPKRDEAGVETQLTVCVASGHLDADATGGSDGCFRVEPVSIDDEDVERGLSVTHFGHGVLIGRISNAERLQPVDRGIHEVQM